jgi:hypothetical protein
MRKSYKLMNVKSHFCKILLIFTVAFGITTVNAEEPRIIVDYPLSGMHTRSSSVLLEGRSVGFSPLEVTITLDDSTTLVQKVKCIDNRFQLELQLGAGKTTISISGKTATSPLIESGFHVYRDCTVTNIVGQTEVYVNTDKLELNKTVTMIGNRSMVPLREYAGFFGAKVNWNDATKKTEVILGRHRSIIGVGAKTATVSGIMMESNPPATIIEGTLYVTARLFSKTVGGGVAWDAGSRTLSIGVP